MQAAKKPHFSSFVQDYNRRLISDALSALEGSIGIVWDEPIMKQLDNVVGLKILSPKHPMVALQV